MEPMNEMKIWVSTSTNVEPEDQLSDLRSAGVKWQLEQQSTWLKTTDSNSELTGIINHYALNC